MMYLVAWIWSWCPTTIQYDLNVCLHIAPSGFLFSAFFCKNAQSGWIWWETKFSTQNLATMALFILSPQINKQFIMGRSLFLEEMKFTPMLWTFLQRSPKGMHTAQNGFWVTVLLCKFHSTRVQRPTWIGAKDALYTIHISDFTRKSQ